MNRLFTDIRVLQLICAICFVLLVVSALLVSKQSYQTRIIYKEMDVTYRNQVSLETLQGKLRIERGSLISPAYIEAHAKQELAMQAPSAPNLVKRQDLTLSAGLDKSSFSSVSRARSGVVANGGVESFVIERNIVEINR